MTVKLLTEHHLEFLSIKGGCTGSSESTFVKMPHCWKSHMAAHLYILLLYAVLQVYNKIDQVSIEEVDRLARSPSSIVVR